MPPDTAGSGQEPDPQASEPAAPGAPVDRSPRVGDHGDADDPSIIDLYHRTLARHAESIRKDGIDLSPQRPDSDFGRGFYLTRDRDQAQRWMEHQSGDEPGAILHYQVPVNELQGLNGKSFDSANSEWENFVRGMRSQTAPMHDYDWVEGPLLMNPQKFLGGSPAESAGHQISVHTPDGVNLLDRSLTPHDAH